MARFRHGVMFELSPQYAVPPVHMVKLTERREITRYRWSHPADDDRL